MPYVTSARSLLYSSVGLYTYQAYGSWLKLAPAARTNAAVGTQTTYSYRTGRGSLNEDSWYGSLSGEDLRKHLKADQRYNSGDRGHEFTTSKTEWTIPTLESALSTPSGVNGYPMRFSGWVIPNYIALSGLPALDRSVASDSQRLVDGATGFRRGTPTAPEAGLAAFLGEMHEGLPSLVGLQALKHGAVPGSAGHEYLNSEFGIKPFIGDLQKFALAVKKHVKIVRQYRRDVGKLVRRKIHLRDESRSETVYTNLHGGGWVVLPGCTGYSPTVLKGWFLDDSTTSISVVDTLTSRAWFSGAYTYFVAEADSYLGQLEAYEQLANKLLGTRLDVDTIWQLTPWSWLIDWFSDLGTFVSNVTALANDSLVLRYGYVMHTDVCSRDFTVTGIVPKGVGPVSLHSYQTFTSKKRKAASPYGFGVDVSLLSPRRWAILGALGMTRAPKSLR